MTDVTNAAAIDKAAASTKLNDAQTCVLFGVTPMTLRHWREGTPRRSALPFATDKEGKRAYTFGKLAKWATDNGIQLKCQLDKALKEEKPQKAKKEAPTATGTKGKKPLVVAAKKAVQKVAAKKVAASKPKKVAKLATEAAAPM